MEVLSALIDVVQDIGAYQKMYHRVFALSKKMNIKILKCDYDDAELSSRKNKPVAVFMYQCETFRIYYNRDMRYCKQHYRDIDFTSSEYGNIWDITFMTPTSIKNYYIYYDSVRRAPSHVRLMLDNTYQKMKDILIMNRKYAKDVVDELIDLFVYSAVALNYICHKAPARRFSYMGETTDNTVSAHVIFEGVVIYFVFNDHMYNKEIVRLRLAYIYDSCYVEFIHIPWLLQDVLYNRKRNHPHTVCQYRN